MRRTVTMVLIVTILIDILVKQDTCAAADEMTGGWLETRFLHLVSGHWQAALIKDATNGMLAQAASAFNYSQGRPMQSFQGEVL